jgi:CheY-like chemotaxis protein
MQLLHAPTLPEMIDKNSERPLVLIVDDHAAVRDMLFWALQLWGYHPICAANGQEAMEWMENAFSSGRYPAAILLDLLMPVVDGPKFLSRMRAHWHTSLPLPPVVLLTVDKSDHANLDCNDILIKPFHLKDLCDILKLLTNQA